MQCLREVTNLCIADHSSQVEHRFFIFVRAILGDISGLTLTHGIVQNLYKH